MNLSVRLFLKHKGKVMLFTLLCLFPGFRDPFSAPWQSRLLSVTNEGGLVYHADEEGNVIPDFSCVGYASGEQEIPDIPVVEVVEPQPGDDLKRIQGAIDRTCRLVPGPNGFRGAILLKKGEYQVNGTLIIPASGIVIRGEGSGTTGTIIRETATSQVDLFSFQGRGKAALMESSKRAIREEFVPTGRDYIILDDSSPFHPGDSVMLCRPATDNWIHDLQMDRIVERQGTKQWSARGYDLCFERIIRVTDGNKVYLDNPVVMQMDKKYGGGYLVKYSYMGRISCCGIEKLRMESDFRGDTDEKHGWYAIRFSRVTQSWVRDVVSRYFGEGCVSIGDGSRNISVLRSSCLDAKSQITGGRRYSFSCNGQLNLIKDCFSTEGRHDYVTGSRVCGPNVYSRCTSRHVHADIGPHHRWACGTLYDMIDTDGEINVQDRGNWGSGHGWAGVTQVIWNCRSPRTAVQSPWVSGKNYCIGLTGGKYEGRFSGRPDGIWEGLNQPGLVPESLYDAQLKNRMSSGKQ